MKTIVSSLIILCTVLLVSAKSKTIFVISDTTKVYNENVLYKVVHDTNNLYINISTTDNNTIMSMLHFGVTVFFDTKGKENEDVYIKYPLNPVRLKFNREQESIQGAKLLKEENSIKRNIANLLEKDFPQEAEYGYFDSQEQFHIVLNTLDVTLSYTYNGKSGFLRYDLKIPKYKISTDENDFLNLSIGVKTGEIPNFKPNKNNGFGNIRNEVGPPPGGKSMPNGGLPPRGSRPPKDQNMQQSILNIDFWFDVDF